MWPGNYLSALDHYFMGFRGHHAAFVVALVVLVGSTVALGVWNPKDDIRRRLGASYFSTDMAFGYGADDLYAMLGKYGGDDYKAHRLFILFDVLYPLLYSISAAVMLGYLLPHALPEEQYARVRYLTLVPLAAALFDLLENLSMLFVLNAHEGNPAGRSDGLVCFSSAMTMLKTVFINATLFMLVYGLFKLLVAAVTGKARPAAPAS